MRLVERRVLAALPPRQGPGAPPGHGPV